jgi:hypothetical protein
LQKWLDATPTAIVIATESSVMSSRRASSKLRPTDVEFWTVVNELPNPLPVSKAEIDAIERYFGDMLDAVFAPARCRRSVRHIKRER